MGKNEPKRASPQPAPGCPPINWTAELERHHVWLRSVVVARVWEREAVEEVLQDVALAAVSSKKPPRTAERVGAWLYKIAVRQALLYRRRQGRQRKLMESYAARRGAVGWQEADPLDWLLNEERQELVRRALECLHRRDREMLLLKYTQKWSYGQIAQHLGVSHSTVESRLHRARQRLRNELARNQVTSP
jgi:RNA polymerase sigma-70 factor (ECF subfamily)